MIKHAAILSGLIVVFLFLVRPSVIWGQYTYDEADYLYAVSLGPQANWLDSPTLPLPEFLKIGLGRGRDKSQRSDLSELIRNTNDVVFYRHWHGPLYIDWLTLLKPFAWDEQSMRALNYALAIATALLMYFGALWLLPKPADQLAATLAAMVYLWSFPVINSPELAPHELFVLCVVAALLLLASQRHWYAAIVATALAACTLEVAFALVATLLICGHLIREQLQPSLSFAVKSAAAFLISILIVWPAAIFKLSFIKAYLFMAYLAMFRKNAWGSDVTVWQTWLLRFQTSPIPWIMLAFSILLIAMRRVPWSPILMPFAIYGVSMFLAILRVNTQTPRYILPLWPAIVLFAAFTTAIWLVNFPPAVRYTGVGLIAAAMFVTSYNVLQERHPIHDPRAYALLDMIRQKHLTDKRLLVPASDLPMIHYYFPRTHLKPYHDASEIPADLSAFDSVIYAR
jgi:hypothetical protein